MIFAADALELARLADSLIGYGTADGFEAQMREAIDGDFPAGADPVEVCIDDIDCALSVLGYVLARDRDPETQCLRYAVDVDGVTASTGIVSSGD